jgi:hypothetical protein
MSAGLLEADDADICIAPELLVREREADQVCTRLQSAPSDVRLAVLGSGHTAEMDGAGMHWNESRVVNGMGFTLWKQRKIWPASITCNDALGLGIACKGTSNVVEHNASGDAVVVVDIEGMGRCVVLICQDLQAEPVTSQILQQFQPDWVLVPILDRNVDIGRWAHQRAISHASLPCRFLLSTSIAYSLKMGATPSTIGLAIAPQIEGSICAPLPPDARAGVAFADVQWGSGCSKWVNFRISAAHS